MSSSESPTAAALAAEREELAAERAALAAEREALDADRARLDADRATLAADRSRLDAERMALAESARLAARQAERAASVPAGAGSPAGPRLASRAAAPTWRELDTGAYACIVGTALTRGEHQLIRQAWPEGWLVASGLEVSDRTRSREVDLLVVAPQGLVVIEQKDTGVRGTLRFDDGGAAQADGRPVPSLSGALRQARLPAQMIGAGLRDAGVQAGYVGALLAVRGPRQVEPAQVGATRICRTDDVVTATAQMLGPLDEERALPVGTVLTILTRLGLPITGLPALQQVGFPESQW